jgi:hypothetical protein
LRTCKVVILKMSKIFNECFDNVMAKKNKEWGPRFWSRTNGDGNSLFNFCH